MTRIEALCQSRGIAAPKILTGDEGKQITDLDDFVKAVKIYRTAKDALDESFRLLRDLSPAAKAIFAGAKIEGEASDVDLVIGKFEETVKAIDRFPFGKKAKLLADRAGLVRIIELSKKAFDEALNIAGTFSTQQVEVFQEHFSKTQGASATKRIISGLENFTESLKANLSPQDKAALGLADSRKVPDYSAGDLTAIEAKAGILIKQVCAPPTISPPASHPMPIPAPMPMPLQKDAPSRFNYSLVLGSGFSGRISGADRPHSFADFERGLLVRSGTSFAYNFTNRIALQFDYRFKAPYDVQRGDKIVFVDDKGDISLRFDGHKLKILGKAGWMRYDIAYPSALNPSTTAGTQGLIVVYQLSDKLSLNLSEDAEVGKAEISTDGESDSYLAFSAQPTVAFRMGDFTLTGGGTVYHNSTIDQTMGGGVAGASYRGRKHDIAFFAKYLMGSGSKNISPALRYYYDRKFGINAAYNLLDLNGALRHRMDLLATMGIRLFGEFYLEPFVNMSVGKNDEGVAAAVGGGLIFRYRDLRPQIPNQLTPHSIDPLPEYL